MKKLLLLFLFEGLVTVLYADTYKIIKLSTPTIVIGNKTCKEGSMFHDNEAIIWTGNDQGLWARNMDKRTYHYFAAQAFKSRKCKSPAEYFRTNKMSTRSGGFDMVIEHIPGNDIKEKRIALVIGNANYTIEKSLSTPIPDAQSISKKLAELGFDVYTLFDANKGSMEGAIKKFSSYAVAYETALVYYAGHGSQFNGDTYLKPVDAVVQTTYDVLNSQLWIPAKRIVSFLNDIHTLKTRLFFIDACRTTENLLVSRGETDDNVLDTDELKEGMIVYSTRHGYEAYDEDGNLAAHSPFATAVIKHISTPNISIGDFITDVMNEVKQQTNVPPYPHPQEPRSIPTLTHRFYFNPIQKDRASIPVEIAVNNESEEEHKTLAIATANPTTPEEYYETGMSLYKKKEYSKAISWFTKSASASYAPAQAMLGVCYHWGEGINNDYGIAKDYYEKAAKKNNAKAINGLGLLYEDGLGVKKDIKKAIKYFNNAAKLGYGAGYYNLALIYMTGKNGKTDYERALEMFKGGAKLNHPRCTSALGLLYENGYGTEINMKKAIEYYHKGVELNDEVAAYRLGLLYRDGEEDLLIQNPKRAAQLFERCKSSGEGQYELAKCYRDGFGMKKDELLAAEAFKRAAEIGHMEAQHETGNCFLYGKGFEKDERQAVVWYEKAALQGYAEAQNAVGYCYSNGYGVDQNYDIANAWFKKSADQNYAWAQYNLGLSFQNGLGYEKDDTQAVVWYEKAATNGLRVAQYRLGICYEYGLGVKEDMNKALEWYEKSAVQNYTDAMTHLANLYYEGKVVKKNHELAFDWWQKAAKLGSAVAQYNTGLCYEFGWGVQKNINKALEWYEKSAVQNYTDAMTHLANLYYEGKVVKKNHELAFDWWQKAAKLGSAVAQYNTGLCYEFGWGVQKNINKALEWYEKSAIQNNANAIQARDRLKK